MTATIDRASRFRGAMLGLAIGDALGASVEFEAPGSFDPVVDLRGGGPWRLEVGQWTDDTSMALCLAESLVERGGFDSVDQLERYVSWWREGKWSCKGYCFDIGGTTQSALARFVKERAPYCGSTDPWSSGNGSLMRLVPVPLFFERDPERAIALAADSSRTTHGSVDAVDACRYFAGLIIGALRGASKEELISNHYSPVPLLWDRQRLAPQIAEIASGSFLLKEPPAIRGSGYVVRSLEAALWAFARGESFRECVLLAVNLGDDADTTGAIAGQIAGAFYGVDNIPESWRTRVDMADDLIRFADALLDGPRS